MERASEAYSRVVEDVSKVVQVIDEKTGEVMGEVTDADAVSRVEQKFGLSAGLENIDQVDGATTVEIEEVDGKCVKKGPVVQVGDEEWEEALAEAKAVVEGVDGENEVVKGVPTPCRNGTTKVLGRSSRSDAEGESVKGEEDDRVKVLSIDERSEASVHIEGDEQPAVTKESSPQPTNLEEELAPLRSDVLLRC